MTNSVDTRCLLLYLDKSLMLGNYFQQTTFSAILKVQCVLYDTMFDFLCFVIKNSIFIISLNLIST